MKRINITKLFKIILLLSSSMVNGMAINLDDLKPLNGSIPNTSTTPPVQVNNEPAQDKQNISSTCHAVRAVMGHDGKIAQWKSNCRVEVWTDKERPELKDLSEEQRESVLKSLAETQLQPQDQSIPAEKSESPFIDPINNQGPIGNFEKSRYLTDEANLHHYMCMEAKRAILSELKIQLSSSATNTISNLKLSPELETFIGQVNDSMKESLARIHTLEQAGSQQLEALKNENVHLTALIDEHCKDDHPSIRYHDVGYLPHPDLEKVKMTLIISKPGKRAEFFNLPENAYARHIDYLRGMTDAVAQHAQITGQQGVRTYEVEHNPYPDPHTLEILKNYDPVNSSNFRMPGLIAITPSKHKQQPENIEKEKASQEKSYEEDLGTAMNEQHESSEKSNSQQPENEEIANKSVQEIKQSPEINQETFSIKQFWIIIIQAEKDLAESITKWTKIAKEKSRDQTAKLESTLKLKEAKADHSAKIKEAILKLIDPVNLENVPVPETAKSTYKLWSKNYKDLNEEEKKIESNYLRSREMLKKARDFAKSKTNLPENIYNFGYELINFIRRNERQALIDKTPLPSKVGTRRFGLWSESSAPKQE